jgi:O-antigen biosynthesis protein
MYTEIFMEIVPLDEKLSSTRYAPPSIDLNNKKNCHTLMIDLTGYNKKVLEIGTSTGYVTKILQERQNEVVGIEKDPEAAQRAEKYCIRMITGDIETIDLDKALNPYSFDVILCGDVLEHLINPLETVKKMRKFLKKDGYLVVSLPHFCHGDVILNILNGDFRYTDTGLLDRTHLHFFGLKNIYTFFSDAGYQISDLGSTHLGIGDTELRLPTKTIPDELQRFIRSLPESTAYQFIFTAHPQETPRIPLLEESNFEKSVAIALEETTNRVNALEQNNAGLTIQVRELEIIITDRDCQVRRLTDQTSLLTDQVRLLQEDNDALRKSITYKVTTTIHRTVIERLCPPGSRRRRYYDRCLEGGRILVNEGLKSLFRS